MMFEPIAQISDFERRAALECVTEAQRMLRRASRDDIATALILLGVAEKVLTPTTTGSEDA